MQLAKHKLPVPRRRPAREAHSGTVTMGGRREALRSLAGPSLPRVSASCPPSSHPTLWSPTLC